MMTIIQMKNNQQLRKMILIYLRLMTIELVNVKVHVKKTRVSESNNNQSSSPRRRQSKRKIVTQTKSRITSMCKFILYFLYIELTTSSLS